MAIRNRVSRVLTFDLVWGVVGGVWLFIAIGAARGNMPYLAAIAGFVAGVVNCHLWRHIMIDQAAARKPSPPEEM